MIHENNNEHCFIGIFSSTTFLLGSTSEILVWPMEWGMGQIERKKMLMVGQGFRVIVLEGDQSYDELFNLMVRGSGFLRSQILHLGDSTNGHSLAEDPKAFQDQLSLGLIFLMLDRSGRPEAQGPASKARAESDRFEGLPPVPKLKAVQGAKPVPRRLEREKEMARVVDSLKKSLGPSRGGKHVLIFKESRKLERRRRSRSQVVTTGCGWFVRKAAGRRRKGGGR